jgi:phosphoesterase RecJ-like protein
MNQELFKLAYEKIKRAKNILLVTHDRPDGDGVSSLCALAELMEMENKKYTLFCQDEPPAQFNYLSHWEKIIAQKSRLDFYQYDLIIALDCGSLNRTNLVNEIFNKNDNQINIEFDHHPKIDDYADLEIRLPEASSTAEVLYRFFKTNQIKINKNIATCILTGMLTDTNNFLYPSTSDTTIQIASEMLVYGARLPIILESAYRNKSIQAMKLWGRALSNLKINPRYNFAYSVLTYDDMIQCPVTDEELEGIAGFLSNLGNVSALLFLREEKNGIIRGSLRTAQPQIDVSQLAQILGGGGHKKASGFVICGHLEKTDNGFQVI